MLTDLAYADDLVSMTGTNSALQSKADIISAFAIVTNMTLALDKFRAYCIHRGNQHNEQPDIITLHTTGWIPQDIKLADDGVFKYLGVRKDLSMKSSSVQKDLIQLVNDECAKIVTKEASAEMKWRALQLVVYARVCYQAKFMSWTKNELKKMDAKVSTFLRKISGFPQSFSTRLLYSSVDDGGMGFTRLSNEICRHKMSIIERAMRRPSQFQSATLGAVVRGITREGTVTSPGIAYLTTDSDHENTWVGPLNSYLESMDCCLKITGRDCTDTVDEPIRQYCRRNNIELTEDNMKRLIMHGISTVGELLLQCYCI